MFGIWFHHPFIFMILLAVIVGGSIYVWRKKSHENFIMTHILSQVYKKDTFWYKVYLSCLITISLLFSIVVADPYRDYTVKTMKKNGIDIEIVFDISKSMVAEDLSPSRIEVAKKVVSDFVWWLHSDRVWMILFAGKPFQSIPLSYDYSFIQDFTSKISVETINQNHKLLWGTAIWDGLILAADILSKDKSEREKIIILITDGEANQWINPALALSYIQDKWIKVYSIGVGKNEETYIITHVTWWFRQKTLIEGVDEALLRKISISTGWRYFRADSPETFASILQTIWALEKKQLEYEVIETQSSQKNFFLFLLFLDLLLLVYIVLIKKMHF